VRSLLEHWQALLLAAATICVAVLTALVSHYVVFALAKRVARRTSGIVENSLLRHGERPTRWIFPLLAIVLVLPVLPFRSDVLRAVQHVLGLGLILSVGWVCILLADVFADAMYAKYRVDVSDNLTARRIRTQIDVLRRIFSAVVIIVTAAVMLMTFPSIHQLGTSLLASAGLAGLIVGMAMKPTLSSLVAGLQIALTEPIRIDDVVIVQEEFGWVEEIGTTYVIIRTWDLRRLVVPLSYFIENPFQNWTRRTADLLGTVFIYVDYRTPVEEVRQELHRILESSGMWDGKVWALQATNASEQTLELRALISAPDAPRAWDLRCYVREKLVKFLQERYPASLPRVRAEVHGLPAFSPAVHPNGSQPAPVPAAHAKDSKC
jgi:small-conductance mechanosensitive channel